MQVVCLFSIIEGHPQRFCEYDLIVNFLFFCSEIDFLALAFPWCFIFEEFLKGFYNVNKNYMIAYYHCGGLIFDVA
jgi:hypothetical protein